MAYTYVEKMCVFHFESVELAKAFYNIELDCYNDMKDSLYNPTEWEPRHYDNNVIARIGFDAKSGDIVCLAELWETTGLKAVTLYNGVRYENPFA